MRWRLTLMNISTRIGINSYLIYTASLGKKTDKEAYIDLLESMVVSSELDNSSQDITIKGNKIVSLDDEELIRIGMEIMKAENLLEYYNQLTYQDDFFYKFKETYNMYLKKAFEALDETFDEYKTGIVEVCNQFHGLIKSIKIHLVEINTTISSVAKSIDIELLRKKVNKAERFNHIAIGLEWFPAAVGKQLSVNDVVQIVEMYDTEGKGKTKELIDHLFIHLYGADEINRLYNGWEKNILLKSRLAILREGLDAHLRKHFNASVCTILPQIEGVIRDMIPSTIKNINRKELEYAVDDIVDSKDFNQATREFYFKFILHRFDHGKELPVLSRHAILHGEDTNFGTEVKSLKAILLFDFLQEKIAEYKIN